METEDYMSAGFQTALSLRTKQTSSLHGKVVPRGSGRAASLLGEGDRLYQ